MLPYVYMTHALSVGAVCELKTHLYLYTHPAGMSRNQGVV